MLPNSEFKNEIEATEHIRNGPKEAPREACDCIAGCKHDDGTPVKMLYQKHGGDQWAACPKCNCPKFFYG